MIQKVQNKHSNLLCTFFFVFGIIQKNSESVGVFRKSSDDSKLSVERMRKLMKLRVANKDIGIVVNALDFYSRIWIGQYGEIDRIRRFYDLDRADYVDFESCNKYYLAIRKILIPELGNENLSGSLGIWNEQTNHLAKSAYDMQQILY